MHQIRCRQRHQKQRPTVQHILKRIASTAAKDNQFNKAQVVTARSPVQRHPDQRLSPKHRRRYGSN